MDALKNSFATRTTMTNPTPVNWRALCAEILAILDDYENNQRVDWDDWRSRTRAALAQPEPQGPTDEELVEPFNENDWNPISTETFLDIARTYWS